MKISEMLDNTPLLHTEDIDIIIKIWTMNIGHRQHVNCLSLYGRLLTGDSQDVFAMDEWSVWCFAWVLMLECSRHEG